MANLTSLETIRDVLETDWSDDALARVTEAAETDLITQLPSDQQDVASLQLSVVQTQAVIDLVQLRLQYDGLTSERVGDYTSTRREYHLERAKVLSRLLFAGTESIIA